MKASLIVLPALGLLAVTAATRASAQSDSASHATPEVRTSATVERRVAPDYVTFTLTFDATGLTPAAAGRTLAARADSLRNALVALGIPRDSLTTGSNWYWWPQRVEKVPLPPRFVPTGTDARGRETSAAVIDTIYRSTEAINVRVHNLRIVGAAIDSALAHRVTNISQLQFRATDMTSVQTDALREATMQARRKATAIAEAGGGRLGRTVLLTTQNETPEPYYNLMEASTAGVREGTQVVEPSIAVSVTVWGRWELIGKP